MAAKDSTSRSREVDALSTKAGRRAVYRKLRAHLRSADPIATIARCRYGLVRGLPQEWKTGRRRPLADPSAVGLWLPQASLNAIVAALQGAEIQIRDLRRANLRLRGQS
jgi:hypothetical protein